MKGNNRASKLGTVRDTYDFADRESTRPVSARSIVDKTCQMLITFSPEHQMPNKAHIDVDRRVDWTGKDRIPQEDKPAPIISDRQLIPQIRGDIIKNTHSLTSEKLRAAHFPGGTTYRLSKAGLCSDRPPCTMFTNSKRLAVTVHDHLSDRITIHKFWVSDTLLYCTVKRAHYNPPPSLPRPADR